MAQAFTVRLPDGRSVRPEDWTSAPLYSSVEIASGTIAPLEAFSYGIGGQVPGSVGPRFANYSDTNFQGQGNILPENEELLIFAISISFFQTFTSLANFFAGNEAWTPDPPHVTLTNVLRVQADTLVRLRIANTKEYCSMPAGFFGAACGVMPYLGSARSQGTSYSQTELIGANGSVSEGDHRLFATPHQVAGGEAFQIIFDFPRGQVRSLAFGADTNAHIYCRTETRGVRRRPVA
jgi:hypothetical protein